MLPHRFWLLVFGVVAMPWHYLPPQMVLAKVHIQGAQCEYNSSICKQSYCTLSKTHGSLNYFSSSCDFIRPVKPLIVHLRLLRKVKARFETFNVDVVYNLCDLHKSLTNNPIANYMITNTVKNVKNLRCPITGNVTATRVPMIMFFAQALLPSADYLVHAFVYDRAGYVLNLTIAFRV